MRAKSHRALQATLNSDAFLLGAYLDLQWKNITLATFGE